MTAGETFGDLGIRVVGGRGGNQKTQCPQCGQPGVRTNPRDKSLSVDAERGLYNCHYCGWKGAIKQGNGYYGRQFQPKVYKKPAPLTPPATPSDRFAAFWANRGISPSTLARYGVTEGDGGIKFPYYRNGELVNVKTRKPNKVIFQESECESIAFGIDQCDPAPEQIVITEGEPDTLACAEAGIANVVSVPNGANKGTNNLDWLVSIEDKLDAAHTVILCVDNDEAGQSLEVELARCIGKGKCCRTRYPDGCKDINDVLMQYGPSMVRECIANAEEFPVEGARWLGEFVESALLLRKTQVERGSSTGWKCLDEFYTVTPGELTIVTGHPGSGKSEWLDALMMNLVQGDGWSFAVYSPESGAGEEHLIRLAKKYYGLPYWPGPTPPMSDEQLVEFGSFYDRRFLILDPERPSIATILGMTRTFVFRNGVRGLVLDPWNRLDHARDKGMLMTEHVRDNLGLLSDFAKRNDIHIWLVAHPRKMEVTNGTAAVPTAYDIADSAHFFNMADNIICVSRDKDVDGSPVKIILQKVRRQRVGRLGTANLRFDRVSGRYLEV